MKSRRILVVFVAIIVTGVVMVGCFYAYKQQLWTNLLETKKALSANPTDELAKRLDSTIERLVFCGDIRERQFAFEQPVKEDSFQKKIHAYSMSSPNAFLRSFGAIENDQSTGQMRIRKFKVFVETGFEQELIDAMKESEPMAVTTD